MTEFSSSSDVSSRLKEKVKRRIIIENPNGTFSHLYKDGEKDSIYEKKEKLDEELCENQRNLENLTLSDEELQYLIDNAEQFDYNNLMNQIVEIFRTYRYIFLFVLIIELLLMSTIMFRTFAEKEDIITNLVMMYKDLSAIEASVFFNCVFVAFIIINTVFYPLGFYSISNKKVKLLKHFANLSIYSAIGAIFIIYINVYFIFIFVLRLILFGFAKFIINLLVSILILPNRHTDGNNNRYGTI